MGALTEKLIWTANRFAAMSAAEVLYRVRQALFRQMAKRGLMTYTSAIQYQNLPVLPGFFDGIENLKNDRNFRSNLARKAKSIRSEPFSAHDKTWPIEGGDQRWHRDPDSGGLWPSDQFCFSIESRHRTDLGDPKYVWELNKLQHLQWAAVHAALFGDQESASYCVAEIESWLNANPPFLGINWASGVECSSRIVSLGVVCTMVGKKFWKPETLAKLNDSLSAHGYWLSQNLSLHSSANNHLIVELAGLYLLGNMCPYLKHAKEWRERSQSGLEREVFLQFAPDGGNREQSPTYGAWSLEWLGLCAAVAEYLNAPFQPATIKRLKLAAAALEAICDIKGNFPRIGDDDDATALAFEGARKDWMQVVIGLINALANKPGGNPPPKLLSVFGWADSSRTPPSGLEHFPDSGLTILRRVQKDEETMVVFDHGPLGYLSIAAHGHADALSIWLHRAGQPVLVDSGTYCYGADPIARDYFRGTSAHNTLTMEGQSSSQMTGPFNWGKRAKSTVEVVDEAKCHIIANHDGFAPVIHHRSVQLDDLALVVVDCLSGSAIGKQVAIRFNLAPDLTARVTNSGFDVSRDRDRILRVETKGPLNWKITDSKMAPLSGSYSSRMGLRVPTQQLHLEGVMPVGGSQSTKFIFF